MTHPSSHAARLDTDLYAPCPGCRRPGHYCACPWPDPAWPVREVGDDNGDDHDPPCHPNSSAAAADLCWCWGGR